MDFFNNDESECHRCDYRTVRTNSFKNHVNTRFTNMLARNSPLSVRCPRDPDNNRMKLYGCFACSFTRTRKREMIKHIQVHTKPFMCKLCGYRCLNKAALADHKLTHPAELLHKCDICGYKTATEHNLAMHTWRHFLPYACRFCNYRCSCPLRLNRHETIHTGDKLYICNYCDASSTDEYAMVTHVKQHTNLKPFPCNFCRHRSVTESNLAEHEREFHLNEPSEWHHCVTRSSTGELRIHPGNHKVSVLYECGACDYTTCDKLCLKMHLREHNAGNVNQRPARSFLRPFAGEEPLACNFCDYSCVYVPPSNQYEGEDSLEKPYKCENCGYRCSNQSLLNAHMSMYLHYV